MSNAGSALMGIGRASGENRAVQAAQQAIESPLLEVSIDGARGVLFNVIGGNNISMHEINTAAETITAAADPDANIIFGATINPELEDELIITVVATGFDATYFNKPTSQTVSDQDSQTEANNSISVAAPTSIPQDDEADVSGLNMDLEHAKHESDFNSEPTIPNIWSIDSNHDDESSNNPLIDTHDEEAELEKPSFLRRLKKRRSEKEKDSESTDVDKG
jgi:cell division protein FtsZ